MCPSVGKISGEKIKSPRGFLLNKISQPEVIEGLLLMKY